MFNVNLKSLDPNSAALKENIHSINEKIQDAARKSGRSASDIVSVAVTKKVSAERVREAHSHGFSHFAENFVQEAILKQAALADLDVNWHFIGHVQSNKIKVLAQRFSLIHSIDREKLISSLDAHASGQEILFEVNLAGEESKSGCAPEELPRLIECVQKCRNLKLKGLMFMAPLELTQMQQHEYYAKAFRLKEDMQSFVSAPHTLNELSMGTSYDFEIAIEEGATLVRLGTVLFGQR